MHPFPISWALEDDRNGGNLIATTQGAVIEDYRSSIRLWKNLTEREKKEHQRHGFGTGV